jgi:hypothetical protein
MSYPSQQMDEVVAQLRELAENRTFRFRNTRRAVAAKYLSDLRRYDGYQPQEIEHAERQMGVTFPASFRAFLLRMGRARGELFRGSDVAGIDDFAEYRREASMLLEPVGAAIPADAVVFLLHQGYSFAFITADGGQDSPVHVFGEGQESVSVAAPTLAAFIGGELRLMREVQERSRQHGVYWLTVLESGGCQETHPALSSGERPLDGADRFTRWWELWK